MTKRSDNGPCPVCGQTKVDGRCDAEARAVEYLHTGRRGALERRLEAAGLGTLAEEDPGVERAVVAELRAV